MSYNQPGPYGGQPQQPGPYGQPGGQPGPYGQQPPVPSGGGGKKVGIILGAVAVVAAVAVGAYFVLGGSGSGADIADDGPHKLTTPATVLGDYKKHSGAGDEMTTEELKKAEAFGIKSPKDVSANYQSGDESNPLAGKAITYGGVYGEIEDPEKAVDSFLAMQKEEAEKNDITFVGEAEEYTPDSLDGAIMKCQKAKGKLGESETTSGGPSEMNLVYCVWGDHSTLGFVMPMEYSDLAAGKSTDPNEAAETAAKLRKEVRVAV